MKSNTARVSNLLEITSIVSNSVYPLGRDDPEWVHIDNQGFAQSNVFIDLPLNPMLGKVFRVRMFANPEAASGWNSSLSVKVRAYPNGHGITSTQTYKLNPGQDWAVFVFTRFGWAFPQGTDIQIEFATAGAFKGIAIGDGAVAVNTNNNRGGIAIGRNAISVSSGSPFDGSVAIGDGADARLGGVAIGPGVVCNDAGTTIGGGGATSASTGNGAGAAVGYASNAVDRGAALGVSANGGSLGAALGNGASGSAGVAVGAGATGVNNSVALGINANASNGVYSVALGSYSTASRRNEICKMVDRFAPSNRRFASTGGWKNTTDATPTECFLDDFAGSRFTLSNASLVGFTGIVVAKNNVDDVHSVWKLEGAIKRGANAAATAIVGTVTKTVLGADAGAATWDVTFTADTTNGSLKVTITGQTSKTIMWVFRLDYAEVTF